MSTETPTITVADLSAKHIGKRIRVTSGLNSHTGQVDGLRFATDHTYGGHIPTAVAVSFPDATITYPLGATVEVQP